MSDPGGLGAVARGVIEGAVAEAERQGELLQLEAELGLPQTTKLEVVRAKRAGRPVGARNRRSESLAAQVERLFGSPVVRALALATMPVEELAASLGCKAIEALQEQRLWLLGVLPYVASRMPIAVDVTDRRVIHLTIADGVVRADAAGEGNVVEVLPYQALSEGDDGAV